MKPNDKVICINSRKGRGVPYCHFPNGYVIKGRIYVVEATEQFTFRDAGTLPCLHLVGMPAIHKSGILVPWPARRFRLLSELKAEAAAKVKQKQKQKQTSKTK